VSQAHCGLAIYIEKYLKAKEEVWKLMLSWTSINEKITYVYILMAKTSTPNLTSHGHPQVKLIARVSVAGVSPALHWVLTTQDLFVVPGPRRVYTSEWPPPCTQPQTLKLCKNNYFEGT
jgi:hypothetical protein